MAVQSNIIVLWKCRGRSNVGSCWLRGFFKIFSCAMATPIKKRVWPQYLTEEPQRSSIIFDSPQVMHRPSPHFLYILIFQIWSQFVQENTILALAVGFPQPCSSPGSHAPVLTARFPHTDHVCIITPVAGLNLLPEKVSRFSELSWEFEFWGSFSSNVKVNPVFSWKGQNSFQRLFPPYSQHFTTPQISFEFSGFYYTSNSFLIKPINTNDRKTCSFRKILSQRRGRGEDRVE